MATVSVVASSEATPMATEPHDLNVVDQCASPSCDNDRPHHFLRASKAPSGSFGSARSFPEEPRPIIEHID